MDHSTEQLPELGAGIYNARSVTFNNNAVIGMESLSIAANNSTSSPFTVIQGTAGNSMRIGRSAVELEFCVALNALAYADNAIPGMQLFETTIQVIQSSSTDLDNQTLSLNDIAVQAYKPMIVPSLQSTGLITIT